MVGMGCCGSKQFACGDVLLILCGVQHGRCVLLCLLWLSWDPRVALMTGSWAISEDGTVDTSVLYPQAAILWISVLWLSLSGLEVLVSGKQKVRGKPPDMGP